MQSLLHKANTITQQVLPNATPYQQLVHTLLVAADAPLSPAGRTPEQQAIEALLTHAHIVDSYGEFNYALAELAPVFRTL